MVVVVVVGVVVVGVELSWHPYSCSAVDQSLDAVTPTLPGLKTLTLEMHYSM